MRAAVPEPTTARACAFLRAAKGGERPLRRAGLSGHGVGATKPVPPTTPTAAGSRAAVNATCFQTFT